MTMAPHHPDGHCSCCPAPRRLATARAQLAFLIRRSVDPERIFAVNEGKALHSRGCRDVGWPNQLTLDDVAHGITGSAFLTRPEAEAWLAERRERHPCRMCRPPISEPVRQPPRRRYRRSGLGWPELAGRVR